MHKVAHPTNDATAGMALVSAIASNDQNLWMVPGLVT